MARISRYFLAKENEVENVGRVKKTAYVSVAVVWTGRTTCELIQAD